MSEKRSFTVVAVSVKGKDKGKNSLGGRFLSSTPSSAARKASTQLCRSLNMKGQCSVMVTLKETTRGSSGKEFKYNVKRVKLSSPEVVMRDGKEVVYKYTTKVKSMKN
jgi:hypothetical protein